MALEAEELKFVASQFRHIHSRQVQHTFRFYSQQWRTWAAIYIQAAWRKHLRRRRRKEEEEYYESDYPGSDDSARALVPGPQSSSKFGLNTTVYASRFAANLRGHRLRVPSSRELVNIPKPSEPDFISMMKSEEVLAYEDCVIFIYTAAAAIVLQHDTICTCKVYVFVS